MSSGSISAMITSLKNNKRTRVSTFKKLKNYDKGTNTALHFDKKATPEQLQKIRERIQAENWKALKTKVILVLIFLTIVIYVVGFVKF